MGAARFWGRALVGVWAKGGINWESHDGVLVCGSFWQWYSNFKQGAQGYADWVILFVWESLRVVCVVDVPLSWDLVVSSVPLYFYLYNTILCF